MGYRASFNNMRRLVARLWLPVFLVICLAGCSASHSGSARPDEPEPGGEELGLPELIQSWYADRETNSWHDIPLAEAFFDYYSSYDNSYDDSSYDESSYDKSYNHAYELRLLPEFAPGQTPDWENVSHWLVYFAAYDQTVEGYRAEDLAKAAAVLLPSYELPRRSSSWLDYNPKQDSFEPTGWDDHGAEYYLLRQFEGDGEQYRALFWVFELDEMWYDELYASTSANDTALLAYAREHGAIIETENEIGFTLDTAAAMRELLLADERRSGMVSRACVEVVFRLSGDEKLPFTYLGCRRWPEDNMLEPVKAR